MMNHQGLTNNIDLNLKDGHLVILHGSTLQYSGPNSFLENNVKMWKKMGYRVTIICQDRDANNMAFVDDYIQGQFKRDTRLLKKGELRVVVPDVNGLVPILAQHKTCNFPGIICKTVHQMTDQEIQTNICLTIKCLKAICQHDKPVKVIANNILLSGIIAQRGLQETKIPYDVTVPGPAIRYTLMPYPHIWKWFLSSFKNAHHIYYRTQFVKNLFLKIFKNQKQQFKLVEKSKIIGSGIDTSRFLIPMDYYQIQKQFIKNVKNSKLNFKNQQIKQKISLLQTNHLFHSQNQNQHKQVRKGSFHQTNLLEKWISYSQTDQNILFVGALINKMGVGELLAIAPQLISKRPTLKFIFSGIGPCKQLMYQLLDAFQEGNLQKAKQIAQNDDFITQIDITKYFFKADKSITERIIFTDFLDQQTISSLMPLCEVYISPGKLPQQCNMSILEALSFGLTPICNDHSWNTEILDSLQKQIPQLSITVRIQRQLFFEKLPITIISTLDYIKNVKSTKKQYRQKIRHIVTNNFSWEHSAAVMAEQ